MCCTCLQVCFAFVVVCICLLVLLLVFTLPLKCKVQMGGKTEINGGLSIQVILKEIPPSSPIFAGIYCTRTHVVITLKMGVKQLI